MFEICFSPTGGTKKVADILAEGMQDEIKYVDLTDNETEFQNVELNPESIALIAVPSYGGRMPTAAVERLSKIKANGSGAILVCVYGNRAYEDTLVELQDTAGRAGFHTIAAVSAVAEHSIVRQIAEGRPDKEDREQLMEFAEKIRIKRIEKNTLEPMIPGNRPYKKLGNTKLVPKPTKACEQCGVCAKQCPVQAIAKENSKMVDKKVCISCMRCVSVCPHSARKIDGVMLAGVGAMLKKVCSERKANELFL